VLADRPVWLYGNVALVVSTVHPDVPVADHSSSYRAMPVASVAGVTRATVMAVELAAVALMPGAVGAVTSPIVTLAALDTGPAPLPFTDCTVYEYVPFVRPVSVNVRAVSPDATTPPAR